MWNDRKIYLFLYRRQSVINMLCISCHNLRKWFVTQKAWRWKMLSPLMRCFLQNSKLFTNLCGSLQKWQYMHWQDKKRSNRSSWPVIKSSSSQYTCLFWQYWEYNHLPTILDWKAILASRMRASRIQLLEGRQLFWSTSTSKEFL